MGGDFNVVCFLVNAREEGGFLPPCEWLGIGV